MYIYKL